MKNSKTINAGFIILISSIFLFGCYPQPKNVSDEIAEANLNFMEAFNKGDAAALAMKYTSDAKLYPSNSDVIEGREAVEGFWNAAMNMGIKKVELETVTATAYGNFAIEEGRYKLYVEGDQMADQGKYIVSWKKEGGQWKLDGDIWNTSNPAPPGRAALNDTVWIIKNRIKADKVAQFEDFNFNYLEPAALSIEPKLTNTVRTLRPVKPNKDGSYTYYYIMDPFVPGGDYDMMTYLTAKYGEEKAEEYIKMFTDCLVEEQWGVKTIQTIW